MKLHKIAKLVAQSYLEKIASDRALFHGTIKDHKRSITKDGLYPSVGAFVEDAYGHHVDEGSLQELVFAADKKGLGKAVSAMIAHISKKLRKNYQDVTNEDVIEHGMLVKIREDSEYFKQKPKFTADEDFYEEYPISVEPGDYYSEDMIEVEWALTGRKMAQFMKRFGEFPIALGLDNDKKTIQEKKLLTRLMFKLNKLLRFSNRSGIMKELNSLTTPKEIRNRLSDFRFLEKALDLMLEAHVRRKRDKTKKQVYEALKKEVFQKGVQPSRVYHQYKNLLDQGRF